MTEMLQDFNFADLSTFFTNPSVKTAQFVAVIYVAILWLAIIVWVTRDAINRSDSIFFQVIAILLNITFPVLGILLYLIIRPSKTTTERYYEDLEHRLILESIHEEKEEKLKAKTKKPRKRTSTTKKKSSNG